MQSAKYNFNNQVWICSLPLFVQLIWFQFKLYQLYEFPGSDMYVYIVYILLRRKTDKLNGIHKLLILATRRFPHRHCCLFSFPILVHRYRFVRFSLCPSIISNFSSFLFHSFCHVFFNSAPIYNMRVSF